MSTGLFVSRASGSTTFLYPKADIRAAFSTTTASYTFDGENIVCPTIQNLIALYNDIYYQTTLSQPIGNPISGNNKGYSCNAGTLLEDMGESMFFKLVGGQTIVQWRLVRQITPQRNPPLSSPGNSPNGTIGFVTVFNSYGLGAAAETDSILDFASVIRIQ
jgi:hypothetical protein